LITRIEVGYAQSCELQRFGRDSAIRLSAAERDAAIRIPAEWSCSQRFAEQSCSILVALLPLKEEGVELRDDGRGDARVEVLPAFTNVSMSCLLRSCGFSTRNRRRDGRISRLVSEPSEGEWLAR